MKQEWWSYIVIRAHCCCRIVYLLQTHLQEGAIPWAQLTAHGRAGWGSAYDQVKRYLVSIHFMYFFQKWNQWDSVQLQPVPHKPLSGQHVHHHAAHPVVPATGNYERLSLCHIITIWRVSVYKMSKTWICVTCHTFPNQTLRPQTP